MADGDLTREAAVAFFGALYRGEQHIPAPGAYGPHGVRQIGGTRSFYVMQHAGMSTYDFDDLTRLVLLAHEYAVRACVEARGRYLCVTITGRGRNGRVDEYHPTLAEAGASFAEARSDGQRECTRSFARLASARKAALRTRSA